MSTRSITLWEMARELAIVALQTVGLLAILLTAAAVFGIMPAFIGLGLGSLR